MEKIPIVLLVILQLHTPHRSTPRLETTSMSMDWNTRGHSGAVPRILTDKKRHFCSEFVFFGPTTFSPARETLQASCHQSSSFAIAIATNTIFHLSVREEHDGVDVTLVALESLHALPLADVPHLRERVARARNEYVLVHGGKNRDRHHVSPVVCEVRLIGQQQNKTHNNPINKRGGGGRPGRCSRLILQSTNFLKHTIYELNWVL